MNETAKRIERAYELLAKLSVSGDSVELLAMARMELREAYKLAKESEEAEAIGQTD